MEHFWICHDPQSGPLIDLRKMVDPGRRFQNLAGRCRLRQARGLNFRPLSGERPLAGLWLQFLPTFSPKDCGMRKITTVLAALILFGWSPPFCTTEEPLRVGGLGIVE